MGPRWPSNPGAPGGSTLHTASHNRNPAHLAQPVTSSVDTAILRHHEVCQGKTGLWRQAVWVPHPDPLLTSSMTLGMMLNHSEPQFPHLKTGKRNRTHLLGLLVRMQNPAWHTVTVQSISQSLYLTAHVSRAQP